MKKTEKTYKIKAIDGTEKEVDNWNLLLQEHGELAPGDKPSDELVVARDLCEDVVEKLDVYD